MAGKVHGKQILDSSVTPQKLTVIPITGTGTNGNIPLFNGTYSVGTSSIYQSSGSVSVYNPLNVNTLTVSGSFSYTDGTQLAGRVLTSDSNGHATWQTPATGNTIGSGDGGLIYYLIPSVNSDIGGYYLASESPSSGPLVTITQSISGTGSNLIGSFASPVGSPAVTSLPTGLATRVVHANVGGSNQYAKLYLELYKRTSGGVETLLRSDYSDVFNVTTQTEILWTHIGTASYTLDITDRIVFKLYSVRVTGSPTNVDVYTYYEDDSPSYVKTTIRKPYGVDTINGLSASAQFLGSVNDSNVTLNISSSGQTHSFNLGWTGLLPISRGGLNNSTFTASQILIVDSSTSSVISSGYNFNDSGTSSTDIWSASKINTSIASATASTYLFVTQSIASATASAYIYTDSRIASATASTYLFVTQSIASATASTYNYVNNNFVSKSGDIMSGNLTASSIYVNNDLTVNGNLTVLGTVSNIYTTNLVIEDNIITLNGTFSGSPVVNAGIEINRGSTTSASLLWDESVDYWKVGLQGSESTIITEAGTGLTKSNNTLSVNFNSIVSNIQGNGLTANGTTLDVNVNSDSLEITNDLIRLKDNISGGRIFSGGLTVSGYGLNTNTWTASNILTVNDSGNGVIGSGKTFNDVGTTVNDIWSASKVISSIASATASAYSYTDAKIASATASENLSLVLSVGNSAGSNQINMNNNKIINVASASSNLDAVNYGQMADFVLTKGGLYNLNGLTQSSQFLTASNDTNVRMNIVSTGSTHSFSLSWNGLLPISRGGLNNSTFTASQILIVDSATNSVVSSGYKFNDGGTTSTDIWSARQTIDNIISTTIAGARASAKVSNIYLRSGDGLPYNTTPFIIPYDGTIKYISISTSANSTWIGEVRNNGTVITGATISCSSAQSSYGSYSINVNAGDQLQLYCNGNSVNNPRMNVIIVKR